MIDSFLNSNLRVMIESENYVFLECNMKLVKELYLLKVSLVFTLMKVQL